MTIESVTDACRSPVGNTFVQSTLYGSLETIVLLRQLFYDIRMGLCWENVVRNENCVCV